MMKAKKATIEKVDFQTLKIPKTKLEILEVQEPSKRKGGVIVKDVDELIQKLQKEAKIIWICEEITKFEQSSNWNVYLW